MTKREQDQQRALRILLAIAPTMHGCVIRRADSHDDWAYVLWQEET